MEILKVGRRGQITLPVLIRKTILKGKYVGLEVSSDGKVMLIPVKIEKGKLDYTKEELEKIKKLAKAGKGKTYKTSQEAKKHIKSL
ncbi:MAG: AbrB/MazE/SpoVT family DNA-binding domain-containing protein [Candidatus Omnitrophota bacterium]|nr:MAG: AbrB/MazE/SpoVT family DNA-binding domain-containing protein [Candidatus Omnitrophota bacterium]